MNDDVIAWDPDLDDAGERYRPVHKPRKASQCEWVVGFGWVYNPTGRDFDGRAFGY